MTFSMTPVTGFPPPTADDFPNFIQFQDEGVNLGGPDADVVNFTGSVIVTRGVGEDANVVTVEVVGGGNTGISPYVPPDLTWNPQAGDYTFQTSDKNNGIASTANTGAPTFTIPSGLFAPEGGAILLHQDGGGTLTVAAGGGVTLEVRSGLLPSLAGQDAVATLIWRSSNRWLLCGDLGSS